MAEPTTTHLPGGRAADERDAGPPDADALAAVRRLSERSPPVGGVRFSQSLRFFHEILGLDHLHYGLWEPGEALTYGNLMRAQERYAENLCAWIPASVEHLLDVGCGTGATARKLIARGVAVEGLAPDAYQEQVFTASTGCPFHRVKLQRFEPQRRYDAVLMSESCQYVPRDKLFDAVRRACPEGHLVLADYFVVMQDGSAMAESGHPLEAFLADASRAGFELEAREDITERTAPTLDLARAWIDRYLAGSLEIILDALGTKRRRLHRLARWLLRRNQRKLADLYSLVDSDAFRRVKRYQLMRFRITPR